MYVFIIYIYIYIYIYMYIYISVRRQMPRAEPTRSNFKVLKTIMKKLLKPRLEPGSDWLICFKLAR